MNVDKIVLRGSPEVPEQIPEGLVIFTPMLPGRSPIRLRLYVTPADRAKSRRGKWEAIMTDVPTGRRFRIRGASCGIRTCYCAARIVEEL